MLRIYDRGMMGMMPQDLKWFDVGSCSSRSRLWSCPRWMLFTHCQSIFVPFGEMCWSMSRTPTRVR